MLEEDLEGGGRGEGREGCVRMGMSGGVVEGCEGRER